MKIVDSVPGPSYSRSNQWDEFFDGVLREFEEGVDFDDAQRFAAAARQAIRNRSLGGRVARRGRFVYVQAPLQ
jgi:hypothetical protein